MADLARMEADRRWLERRGLARRKGESAVEHLRRLAEYRAQVSSGTLPKPGPLEWAHKIVARHAAGRVYPLRALELAKEALGLTELPERGSTSLDGRKASVGAIQASAVPSGAVAEVTF